MSDDRSGQEASAGMARGEQDDAADRRDGEALRLYAEFTAKPGHEDRVEQMIRALAERVRAEPGNLEFSVYRERERPRRFFVMESYADDQAFHDHITAGYGVTFNAELAPLIEEDDGSQLTWLSAVDTT